MSFDEAIYEVLQTSRYDRLTGRSVDFRQVVGEWIERFIIWIISRLGFLFPDGSNVNTNAVAVIFVVVGGLLVIVAGIVLARNFLRSRVVVRHDLRDVFEELANNKYTVVDLLELSRRADSRRVAVRYRYIAALLALNERQIIIIEPSATNAIILRQVRESAAGLVPAFERVADVFHRAWFGNKNVSDEAFDGFVSAVDTLVKGGGSHA